MTCTHTAGSIRPGDRILDPVDGTPRTVTGTVGGAPIIGLYLLSYDTTGRRLDALRTLTLTDPVTIVPRAEPRGTDA